MEKTLKEQLRDEMLLLYRESYFAKAQNILLSEMYTKILLNSENNLKYLLATTFDAIEFSVLLKLTKIYDADKDRKSITLIHVLNKVQSNKELNNNNDIIKRYTEEILKELDTKENEISKIKICRDKVVSHMDKKYPYGLLSLKVDEQINFELLEKYSDYAYNTIKRLYEIVFKEQLLDSKQFEILEKEYESIEKRLKMKE